MEPASRFAHALRPVTSTNLALPMRIIISDSQDYPRSAAYFVRTTTSCTVGTGVVPVPRVKVADVFAGTETL